MYDMICISVYRGAQDVVVNFLGYIDICIAFFQSVYHDSTK